MNTDYTDSPDFFLYGIDVGAWCVGFLNSDYMDSLDDWMGCEICWMVNGGTREKAYLCGSECFGGGEYI